MEEKIVGLGPATCSLLAPAFVVVAEDVQQGRISQYACFPVPKRVVDRQKRSQLLCVPKDPAAPLRAKAWLARLAVVAL
jgi:hypothetical protein